MNSENDLNIPLICFSMSFWKPHICCSLDCYCIILNLLDLCVALDHDSSLWPPTKFFDCHTTLSRFIGKQWRCKVKCLINVDTTWDETGKNGRKHARQQDSMYQRACHFCVWLLISYHKPFTDMSLGDGKRSLHGLNIVTPGYRFVQEVLILHQRTKLLYFLCTETSFHLCAMGGGTKELLDS